MSIKTRSSRNYHIINEFGALSVYYKPFIWPTIPYSQFIKISANKGNVETLENAFPINYRYIKEYTIS